VPLSTATANSSAKLVAAGDTGFHPLPTEIPRETHRVSPETFVAAFN
jgi:hypothetical protein